MKYYFCLFFIINVLQASDNQLSHFRRFILRTELIDLRNQIIMQDRVIQHELQIHNVILNSLLNSYGKSIYDSVTIDNEINRFLRVIRLRSKKNKRYNELRQILQLTPLMEDSLPISSINNGINDIPLVLQSSGSRRSRSQISNETIIVSQSSNISYISSSRIATSPNSRANSSSNNSIEPDETIPNTENNQN